MRRYLAIAIGVAVMGVVGGLTSSLGSAHTSSASARMAATAAGGGKIKFSTPTIVDPIHTFGEPTISYNIPRNEFFASGPTGTGTQRSVWYGSVDQGHTFRAITPGVPPNAIQSFNAPPGGGDTDLNFDRAGNEYFADLYALLCQRSAVTRDGGATAQQGFDACGQQPGSDRQWLAVYDPPPNIPHKSAYKGKTPLIYLEFNNLTGPGPNGGGTWQMSTDGTNWSNAAKGVTLLNEMTYSPFGPDGYPAIDQETGKVFQAAAFPEGFPNQPSNPKWDLLLNIGTPDSSGQLTFLDHPTTSGGGPNYKGLIPIVKGLKDSPDTLFSVLSMDSARNLYVVYMENDTNPTLDQAFVSASSAASGWRKWTTPVQVSDGSTTTGDAVNIMPWIKAGGPGRADAVWYGQDKSTDPSNQTKQKWNVFMSQLVFPVNSSGQITGAAPHKTLVKVTPHPMHYGGICLLGTGCITAQGNRNVADFFSITSDKHGAAQIIYDDTSNGLVQPGTTFTGQQADHAGAPLVTIAKQSSGMGLYGKPVHATSNAPVSGMNDRAGDARYPLFGSQKNNLPAMDIRHSSLALSGDPTLTVTMKVVDLNKTSNAMSTIPFGNFLQYVTRWQMGNTVYFAGMSTSGGSPSFYAGKAGSIDLCSVSACFPHVLIYPEMAPSVGGGTSAAEKGKVSCPKKPSASSPCTITITVNTADVGKPKLHSLLQEVGAYALATSHPQWETTNSQAQLDNVPVEIDGVCCFNFEGAKAPVHHHHHHHHHVTHHHHHHHHHVVTHHHHHKSKKPKTKRKRGFTG